MPGNCKLFGSIDEVDLAAWEEVRTAGGSSIFMDPRFLVAVEVSMQPVHALRYLVIYDDNRPVACAALCAMTLDVADLASSRLASLVRRVPKSVSILRGMKALFCGLPGCPGEKNLAFSPAGANPQVLRLIDEVIRDLALREGTHATVYKEFGNADLALMDGLLELGYRRIATPSMNLFSHPFKDFAQYCAALSAHYRSLINRSIRKMKSAGIKVATLTDPEEIVRRYTAEVHALYHQTVAKAEVNIELLPIEFFHQLALRLPGSVEVTVLTSGARIVAAGWAVRDGATYHMSYLGLDYELNRELDLYFNLVYAVLDRALQLNASRIHVGQTADAFKARLGCHAEPLYAFTKGYGLIMSPLAHYGASLLAAPPPQAPPRNIFKEERRL